MRNFFINMIFLFVVSHAIARMVNNATDLPAGGNTSVTEQLEDQVSVLAIRSRMKRYISQSDMLAVVDYHNQVRAQVFPPAANMEYMVCIVYDQVWDESLARSAESWAATCIWDHGPPYLLRYLGQNLSIRTGRYQSILQLVKPWYDEVKDYVFPYPQECNPTCPIRCYGPMCTHYTQMVWGATNRVGCAIQVCYNMVVWGYVWRQATYLVCDYSPKGNWVGEAPYKVGVPCSACPTNYGGSCRNNMCFPPANSNFIYWFKYSALIWTGLALLSMCYVMVLVSHLHTRSDAQTRSDHTAGLH